MKILLFCILLLTTFSANCQSQPVLPKYQYYFIQMTPTSKVEIELAPEDNVYYADIDSLIVTKVEINKKGYRQVTGKKYDSFSAAFNALSGAGLEFVQFAYLNKVGGMTAVWVGESRIGYSIWRKQIKE